VPFSVCGLRGVYLPDISVSGTLRSCAFSSLQRFSPPCGLSSLFHLETLVGFSFRAFSCKRLVASSLPILSGLEAPSALYRWLLHAHVLVLAVFIAFESQRCSSILGAYSLLQLVPLGQGLVGFNGRCSLGFQSSSGDLSLCAARSPP